MRLYSKETIYESELEQWKIDALKNFDKKLEDSANPFPCIPATYGHRLNRFRYGFVSCPHDHGSAIELAHVLEEYSSIYKSIGSYTSLIVFYQPSRDEADNSSVEQYEQIFWDQLNAICKMDKIEWPNHIPTDPHDSLWEYCFNGEQYFMYCATPSHINRNSRYFPYFMLAITPRWVLERFNASPSHASKTKDQIRKRLADYDSIDIHPDLNTYGQEDNFEWKQYFLRDNHTSLSKCPFHKK